MIEGAKPAPFLGFVEPCCPTLRKTPPSGEACVHEIKHDGYRARLNGSHGRGVALRTATAA